MLGSFLFNIPKLLLLPLSSTMGLVVDCVSQRILSTVSSVPLDRGEVNPLRVVELIGNVLWSDRRSNCGR